MKCPNCGFENDEKNNECIICGASFTNIENPRQENETPINYEENPTQEYTYPVDNYEEYIPQDTEIYDNKTESYYYEIEPYENGTETYEDQTRTCKNERMGGFIDNHINNLKNMWTKQNEIQDNKMRLKQEKEMNEKPQGALFYVDGREAAISIFEDYIELNFSKTLMKKFLGNLGGKKRIYYHQINSIQVRDGNRMINGTIEFELPGMSLGRNYGGNSGTRENLIHFTYNYNDEIHKIEEYVNNKILQIHNPQQNTVTQEKDNVTQLKEAKELLDQGIITQEEFNQIKTKIMNNI